jgi:deoxyribodipyrimidine photo-lyase
MTKAHHVVWFKRDLRTDDHVPLTQGAKAGPCRAVYVLEPELIESAEFSSLHWRFLIDSLKSLDARLRELGGELTILHGNLPDVFEQLHQIQPITHLHAHEETGNWITYQRDVRVQRWAHEKQIPFDEYPQTGVVRRLKNRDGWSRRWNTRMKEPLTTEPERITPPPTLSKASKLPLVSLKRLPKYDLPANEVEQIQPGGVDAARETLDGFLGGRGRTYSKGLSSPVTAFEACSRLSPYLTGGNLSMRQVHQATQARAAELREAKKSGEEIEPGWLGSLRSFGGRLRWHCHFMQKLEDEPRLEFENLATAMDGLREDDFNEEHFAAWCAGQTGYPMVDACMRALHQYGWINFRMRAMLVSFTSYHLWLHWRRPAQYLAQYFTDFEPGIHFSQVQMQSGTTGINTVRIYSPAKQVKDHDPGGVFLKRMLPELEGVPAKYLAEPHTMPADVQAEAGCIIGKNYPAPIVDHATAYKEARTRIYSRRSKPDARVEAQKIVKKHGSRRRPEQPPRRQKKTGSAKKKVSKSAKNQLEFAVPNK